MTETEQALLIALRELMHWAGVVVTRVEKEAAALEVNGMYEVITPYDIGGLATAVSDAEGVLEHLGIGVTA